MKSMTLSGLMVALLGLAALPLHAQNAPYVFYLTFRGTIYQTNTTGQFVATPITETNLLQDAAAAGGIDASTLALVYHVQGGSYGDTIDIVYRANGQVAQNMFELAFGDDGPLNGGQVVNRTALTNAPGTEMRRLDYIYMYHDSTYTSQNNHSMGACFTTKRFLGDRNGNVHSTISGQMHWIVNPIGEAGTKICTASFTTTKPVP